MYKTITKSIFLVGIAASTLALAGCEEVIYTRECAPPPPDVMVVSHPSCQVRPPVWESRSHAHYGPPARSRAYDGPAPSASGAHYGPADEGSNSGAHYGPPAASAPVVRAHPNTE